MTPVVVPGTALTADILRPCRRLKSVDLPLLTGPTITNREAVSCATSCSIVCQSSDRSSVWMSVSRPGSFGIFIARSLAQNAVPYQAPDCQRQRLVALMAIEARIIRKEPQAEPVILRPAEG